VASIIYVSDQEAGIRRRRRGKKFTYLSPRGRELNGSVAKRIDALAIPPAWTDVWICPDPSGHIQATGRDARGRKQYRYHTQYRRRRELAKFRDLAPFGEALGGLRKRIDEDLRSPALSQDRVVAAVVSLIGQTFGRVGNDAYARENKTFGITTLRSDHVDINGSHLRMCFVGKGGKEFDLACCDPRIARVVRRCQDLPGQRLFQYVNDDGQNCAVTSTDINDYLRDATGLDATAKTFRTWGATLLATQVLAELPPPESDAEFRRELNAALRPVADALGNTVAVCRASYVHPKVIDCFERGSLPEQWSSGPSRAAHRLTADERRLLAILKS
jgi:DNA topoisomerase-1